MRFDIEKGSSQFMRNIADELAFGFVEFYLAVNVLHGHGNALNTFPILSRTVVRRIRMVRLVGWMRVIELSCRVRPLPFV